MTRATDYLNEVVKMPGMTGFSITRADLHAAVLSTAANIADRMAFGYASKSDIPPKPYARELYAHLVSGEKPSTFAPYMEDAA